MENKNKKNWQKKWIWILLGAIGVVAILWFFGSDTASAQSIGQSTGETEQGKAIYGNFINLVLLFQQLLNKILWPILFLIGGLLDNDLIFNHGMETRLLAIWVQIRNIVNIFFVIALVGVALYNVFGIGGEGDQFSLKSILPKLIIGIIAVNFSYIAMKVVLDSANVFTTAVFGLPEAVEQGLSNVYTGTTEEVKAKREIYEKAICTNLYGAGGATEQKVQGALNKLGKTNLNAKEVLQKNYLCDTVHFNKAANQFFQKFGAKNAAIVMAVNMSKVAFIDKAALQSATSFSKVGLNVLFSLILYFVYVASFLALFIILVARLIVLWIGVALSPIILLSVALPAGVKEQLSFLQDLAFFKHAFIPIQVAFPMTIGFMMLKAFQGINFGNVGNDVGASLLSTGTLDIGLATSGISTLQELLIAIVTIGVVWQGVFSAAKGTIAESIVGTVKEGLQGFGKFIGGAPFKYIPWIPVKTGGGESVNLTPSAILDAAQQLPQRMEDKSREEARKVFPWLQPTGSTSDLKNIKNVSDLERAMKGNAVNLKNGGTPEALKALHEGIKGKRNLHDSQEYRDLYDALKRSGGKRGSDVESALNAFYKKTGWGGSSFELAAGAAGAVTSAKVTQMIDDAGGEDGFKELRNKLPKDLQNTADVIAENKGDDGELKKVPEGKVKQIETIISGRKAAADLADDADDTAVGKVAEQIKAAVGGNQGLADHLAEAAPEAVKGNLKGKVQFKVEAAPKAAPQPKAAPPAEAQKPAEESDEEE